MACLQCTLGWLKSVTALCTLVLSTFWGVVVSHEEGERTRRFDISEFIGFGMVESAALPHVEATRFWWWASPWGAPRVHFTSGMPYVLWQHCT